MVSNSTMVDYYKRNATAVAMNTTMPPAPKWKYTYYGFMIDLLEEIKVRYKKKYSKDFPEYEITTSPSYFIASDPENGGGFGYRSIPKTGAGAKKEEKVEDGTVPPGQLFHGLVKDVACDKVLLVSFLFLFKLLNRY